MVYRSEIYETIVIKNRMKNEEKKHNIVDNDSKRETSTSCYPG